MRRWGRSSLPFRLRSRARRQAVKVLVVGCLGVAVFVWAADPVVREGAWWVRTVTGSEAAPAGALRVVSHGDVTLEGGAGSAVSWVLKVRTKARGLAEARARLSGMEVRPRHADGQLVLTAAGAAGDAALALYVPRGLREVVVATSEGVVRATGLEGALVATSGAGGIYADRIGRSLVARTGGGEIVLGEMGGTARCATGGGRISARLVRGDAVLETGAGDIAVEEVRGMVRATTMGGTVRIGRAGGTVIASTGGGQIDVGQARGLVEVRNSGGPVRVGAASGVRCETATGGIRLSNVSGSLRASTAIGSILAQLVAGPAVGDSFLATGRGDITVVIPSNVGVKIRAENEVSGGVRRIVSDYPGIAPRVRGAQVVAEGDINGGGPLLRISGTGGTIYIRRQ